MSKKQLKQNWSLKEPKIDRKLAENWVEKPRQPSSQDWSKIADETNSDDGSKLKALFTFNENEEKRRKILINQYEGIVDTLAKMVSYNCILRVRVAQMGGLKIPLLCLPDTPPLFTR